MAQGRAAVSERGAAVATQSAFRGGDMRRAGPKPAADLRSVSTAGDWPSSMQQLCGHQARQPAAGAHH